MNFVSCCAKCILVLVTLLFLLLGIIFSALGVLLKFGIVWIVQYIEPILGTMLSSLSNMVPDTFKPDFIGAIYRALLLVEPVAILLLVMGVFFVVLSICGMCGACCSNRILLIIYLVVTIVLMGLLLALAVRIYTAKDAVLDKRFKSTLEKIQKNYKGVYNADIDSWIMNVAHVFLKCCGIDNGTDYNGLTWDREMNVTINGVNETVSLVYPLTCCKMTDAKAIDVNCTFDPTPKNSNYNVGCWSRIATPEVMGYLTYFSYGLFGICGLLLILVLLGVCVIVSMRDSPDNKVRPDKSYPT